jgi:hypothetical protein
MYGMRKFILTLLGLNFVFFNNVYGTGFNELDYFFTNNSDKQLSLKAVTIYCTDISAPPTISAIQSNSRLSEPNKAAVFITGDPQYDGCYGPNGQKGKAEGSFTYQTASGEDWCTVAFGGTVKGSDSVSITTSLVTSGGGIHCYIGSGQDPSNNITIDNS